MDSKTQRYFFIGSEWLYYKLYMGSRISDIFLTSTLTPIANELLKQEIIDKWFFINYKDPERHVRIRFRVIDPKNLNYVIQILHKAINSYVNEKTINKVVIDTYKRELERYGNETIEESESIFFINSRLIVYLISRVTNDNQRWLWGMKTIDTFLDAWNMSVEQKRDFFEGLKKGFDREMGATTDINRQLSMKFRNNRGDINTILEQNSDQEFDMVLQNYFKQTREIVSQILTKRKAIEPKLNMADLLGSYIHMHCNRLFKSNQRLNEWVLYNYLFQYYRSKAAQMKSETSKKILIAQE
ncbi:thiopeptide-type bacteriocin biosynthesis protein [Aquimarina spongiae]|uniref:Thiopeptide-type bacteriocin biosynthesis domain-containing protein n=1 Tax=Aquimarina spongiae TaxID=570521 RepID=A0A1M6IF98_9FLAO|nr:thiopeptide-type bacteriocin biosynthesis protein [Aquimarina spongiae]SHJ33098.1 thiopeptide-type bacteriocin biosynthesis domain-containing protein [Aquimarina spongiae]